MPPRALASATISFGLVSIPVKLYPAGESADTLAFHWLHQKCGSRLRIQYFCPKDREVVPRKEMVKGYEVAKGRYVTFTPQELEAVEQVSTQTIEIEEFLPSEAIDPIYFVKAYYLGPDKAGAKGYRLLAQVLRKSARVAIGRYAARGKQYLVLLRALRESLVLHQLHHRGELRKPVEIPEGEGAVKDSELKLAERLVEQGEGEAFRPERYPDEVRGRVRALIRKKAEGEEVTVSPPERRTAQVIDLMDALKASLSRESATEKETSRSARRKPARRRSKQAAR
ncbi:MAG TPA: Ku protein, partial [Candidatus Binatia bacterium]|nr:Ku protein [Candidatus Binatia bacterium]